MQDSLSPLITFLLRSMVSWLQPLKSNAQRVGAPAHEPCQPHLHVARCAPAQLHLRRWWLRCAGLSSYVWQSPLIRKHGWQSVTLCSSMKKRHQDKSHSPFPSRPDFHPDRVREGEMRVLKLSHRAPRECTPLGSINPLDQHAPRFKRCALSWFP
jgi:hypothetical protein